MYVNTKGRRYRISLKGFHFHNRIFDIMSSTLLFSQGVPERGRSWSTLFQLPPGQVLRAPPQNLVLASELRSSGANRDGLSRLRTCSNNSSWLGNRRYLGIFVLQRGLGTDLEMGYNLMKSFHETNLYLGRRKNKKLSWAWFPGLAWYILKTTDDTHRQCNCFIHRVNSSKCAWGMAMARALSNTRLDIMIILQHYPNGKKHSCSTSEGFIVLQCINKVCHILRSWSQSYPEGLWVPDKKKIKMSWDEQDKAQTQ